MRAIARATSAFENILVFEMGDGLEKLVNEFEIYAQSVSSLLFSKEMPTIGFQNYGNLPNYAWTDFNLALKSRNSINHGLQWDESRHTMHHSSSMFI
jgi:hypothetical protein